MRKITLLLMTAILSLLGVSAQEKKVTGKVSDGTGNPVPGASILVKGTTIGTSTDASGNFTISLPDNSRVLIISAVGFDQQEVSVGSRSSVSITLNLAGTQEISEVVVTGVAQGQSIKKTPFAITKVSSDRINVVPGTDASQSLRGKVAGIQISQAQGDGGAAVFLRGAKSVFGNISPLIVVDGFQTNLSLSDLVAEDIESIEVVKGAAASSLYGSRAEGGVIQVITKKGKKSARGAIQFQSEYGISDIQTIPERTNYHPYQVNADGSFVLSGVTRSFDYKSNGFSVNLNPYKENYDNTRALLDNRPYNSNFLSYSNAGDKFNVYASVLNQYKGGIVVPMKPDRKLTGKFNFNYKPTDKFEAGINFQYYSTSNPSAYLSRNNQGTVFASTLQFEPFINLLEKDAEGDYAVDPTGFNIQGANLSNPLYEWSKREVTNKTDEFLAGINLKYHFTRKLNLEISGSVNKSNTFQDNFYPVGYKTRLPSASTNNGYYGISNFYSLAKNGNAQLNYNTSIGKDFDLGFAAKYIYEEFTANANGITGYDMSASVKDIGATTASTRSAFSSWSQTVRHNVMANGKVAWKDKLFFDVVGRLDNSSRFGEDAASAIFYRGALAYRLTQDFEMGPVTELKLRAAYGTAGSEPPYGAKDSKVSTSGGSIVITQFANPNLQRSVTSETEVGFDATLWNKINVQFNYADSKSENDFIQVPSFTPTTGSAGRWANLGAVTSNSIELEINGDIYKSSNSNFIWKSGFTFGRVRSKITDLGGIPEFLDGGLFWKGQGLSAYAFYGQKVIRSIDDLQVDGSGNVISRTSTGAIVGGGSLQKGAFTVNSMGFVVETSKLGTANEEPLFYSNPETGNLAYLGRGEPDFVIGFSNTLVFFKNISLYFLLDWKQGGLKYNQTTQYLTFDSRTKVWEDFARAGLPASFIQKVYNGNSVTDYWLEDNSYLSLREVNLSYDVPVNKIGGVSKVIKGVKLNVTGRNLYNFSKYRGSNLEGYYEYYPYPVYRTFSGRIILNF